MAASSVALLSSTILRMPVSTRYIITIITMVLFASSRDHDRTSYHSSFLTRRLMALTWNCANGALAYIGKKNFIHSRG